MARGERAEIAVGVGLLTAGEFGHHGVAVLAQRVVAGAGVGERDGREVVPAVEVAAQIAVGILPAAVGRRGGGEAGGEAEAVQEAVGGERVEVGLVDLGLLLEEAVEQADLRHGEWHELVGLGGDEVVRLAVLGSSMPRAARPRVRLPATAVMPARTLRRVVRNGASMRDLSAAQTPRIAGYGSVRSLPSCSVGHKQNGKTKSLRVGGSFVRLNGGLVSGADEEQREGEQCQRLDEGEADEEEELNSGTCAGIARHCFRSGGRCAALAETAKAGGDAHADADREGVVVGSGSRAGGLGKRRRRQEASRPASGRGTSRIEACEPSCYSLPPSECRRQWVVDAHRAGTLTLSGVFWCNRREGAPRERQTSNMD